MNTLLVPRPCSPHETDPVLQVFYKHGIKIFPEEAVAAYMDMRLKASEKNALEELRLKRRKASWKGFGSVCLMAVCFILTIALMAQAITTPVLLSFMETVWVAGMACSVTLFSWARAQKIKASDVLKYIEYPRIVSWVTCPVDVYSGAIPAEAQTAVDLLQKELPGCTFDIHRLDEDPFISLMEPNGKRTFFWQWDEPGFEDFRNASDMAEVH